MPDFGAIIAAGGAGLRFGSLKQKAIIAGKTALQWSIDALRPHCVLIVIAAPPDYLEQFESYRAGPVIVAAGGATRVESIVNAFAKIPMDIPYVLVHDAVRPAVSDDLIDRVKAATIAHGAAIPAIPITDTIKNLNRPLAEEAGGKAAAIVKATLDRRTLVAAQTPQGFRCDWYREIIAHTIDAALPPAPLTDDAALLEKAGKTVAVVAGDSRNLKLTTPDDLFHLQRILSESRPAS